MPTAAAGPGGSWPAPGPCDYPGVGQSGLIGVVPYFFCDFPTEANGTHWHCEGGGAAIYGGGIGANGLSIVGLGTFGFAFDSCYFKWPNGSLGPAPNPPGAWKNFLVPAPVPIQNTSGPQPYDQTQDVSPPPVLPPPPPPDCGDNCPPGVAFPPPQIIPPPVVEPPTMQPPIVPGAPEMLPPPPEAGKVGEPVRPGEGNPAVTNPGATTNPGTTQNPPMNDRP